MPENSADEYDFEDEAGQNLFPLKHSTKASEHPEDEETGPWPYRHKAPAITAKEPSSSGHTEQPTETSSSPEAKT